MKDMTEFVQKLEECIDIKKENLNAILLPEVRKNYNIQGTAVKAIKDILLKKRLIHDDPYKYDSKMKEIEILEMTPFPDSEKASVMGARVSHYETMIDFLNNYYQFTTEFLTPKKISKLIELNNTFLWSNFSTTANHINTKALADIMQNIFSGVDKLSSSLLRDSLSHLTKTDKEINSTLKELSFVHRQEYKTLVRKSIMNEVSVSKEDALNPSKILKEIKKVFLSKNKKSPFYTDLVIEMIKEDYANNKEQLRQNILSKLQLKKAVSTIKQEEINYRQYLLSGLRVLGNTATHFKSALEKIKSNNELIYTKNLSPLQKLAQALKLAFNIKGKNNEIIINITDPITQIKKKQVVNYNQFETEITKKIILFNNIINPGSQVQQKIKTFNDETLLANLTKYISESNELLKQMAGLDEFYKTIKPELKGKIRGIKIEITTITNSLIKANQERAEYSSAVEESEQMKKLGLI